MPLPQHHSHEDKKVDQANKHTFPASDAPASTKATSTEAPKRPIDRKASPINREDIEAARRGDGHKQ